MGPFDADKSAAVLRLRDKKLVEEFADFRRTPGRVRKPFASLRINAFAGIDLGLALG